MINKLEFLKIVLCIGILLVIGLILIFRVEQGGSFVIDIYY